MVEHLIFGCIAVVEFMWGENIEIDLFLFNLKSRAEILTTRTSML